MKVYFFLSLMLASGLLWSGCKTPAPNPPARKKSASPTSADSRPLGTNSSEKISPIDKQAAERRVEALARYATGISLELNEKTEDALEEFYKSAMGNPANETLVIELANRFAQNKQTDKAIEILRKSADRPDATGGIFAMLSRIYLVTGKTNQALVASQSAIKRSPQLLISYQSLADIYSQTGRTPEVLKTLDQASHQAGTNAGFIVTLADLYANFCKLHPKEKEAITPRVRELLHRAEKLPVKNIILRQKLADNLNYFGESKRAAEIYVQLLNSDYDMEIWRDILREKLANIYLFDNDRQKAAEQLEEIVHDNPTKYPQAYYALGSIAYEAKDFGEAADYFEKTILINPQQERAYYDLAGAQINLNQAAKALETLDKARARFKESFVIEFFSAIACNKLKNYPEALKHYTGAEILAKANETNRLDNLFYFQVAACYERNHDFTEAEKYFQKSLEMAPNDPEALNYLGYMWAERGVNLTKARELIEKAVKIEPKNAAYLDSLGWVLFKLNQPKEALPHILKSIELMTEEDATVYDHLGDIYQLLKESEKARQAWKKSLSIEANEDVKKKLGATL